jgi:uncharacterized membrane protein YgaE (UPF0421/DUF939 family)
LSANVLGHGENPWIYAIERVFDNWIGIAIGLGINALFRSENPERLLSKNLTAFLEKINAILEKIIQGSSSPIDDIDKEINFLQDLQKHEDSILARSLYGRLGLELLEDNWNTILINQKKIVRYLRLWLKEFPALDHSLLDELREPINTFWCEISRFVTLLIDQKTVSPDARSQQVTRSRNALERILDRLRDLRESDALSRYSLAAIDDLYQFIFANGKFLDEIEKIHRGLTIKNYEIPRQRFDFHWRSISEQRWKLMFKTGLCIGLTVTFTDSVFHLPYHYYAVIAIVVSMQPTFGKGIIAGKQRVICTAIGAVLAWVLIHTLGNNLFTLGFGITLTILVCSYFGFTTGYTPGLVLFILVVLVHSSESDGYIFYRFLETLLGVVIALAFYPVFWFRSSSHELGESLEKNLTKLQDRYDYLIDRYFEDRAIDPEAINTKLAIAQALREHRTLRSELRQERVESFLAARKVKLWDTLIDYEETLALNLALLEEAIELNPSRNYRQRYGEELTAIAGVIRDNLRQVAITLAAGATEVKITDATRYFQAIEEKRTRFRTADRPRRYSLEEAIALITVISIFKDMNENLVCLPERSTKR